MFCFENHEATVSRVTEVFHPVDIKFCEVVDGEAPVAIFAFPKWPGCPGPILSRSVMSCVSSGKVFSC